jgi:hypothetical protein
MEADLLSSLTSDNNPYICDVFPRPTILLSNNEYEGKWYEKIHIKLNPNFLIWQCVW